MTLSRRGAFGTLALPGAIARERLGPARAEEFAGRVIHGDLRSFCRGETLELKAQLGACPAFDPADPLRVHLGFAEAPPGDARPAPAGWDTLENLR